MVREWSLEGLQRQWEAKLSSGGDLAHTLFLRALILQAIKPSKNRGLATRDKISTAAN